MAGKLTPRKISARNPVCRLCGNANETRHMLRIFSKSGKEKDLCFKVQKTCGIQITEDDTDSKVICRKCEAFVYKIYDFIQRGQAIQTQVQQTEYSVKRCVDLSPSSQQTTKRVPSAARTSARQLSFATAPADETPVRVLLPKPTEGMTCSPLPDDETLLNDSQQQKLMSAVKSKYPTVVAEIVKEYCPSILGAIKKTITDEINASCRSLCKRSGGSVLYGNHYESLRDFEFLTIWAELEAKNPFLIEVMNSISGINCGIENMKHELKVKYMYSFLYSVLMNERWHELNLLKRINTVLIIEGGCTKQVCSILLM